MANAMREKDLLDGYTAYTTAEELDLYDGEATPAATSPLVPILIRATVIATRSSQQCAAGVASAGGGVVRTIKKVC
ncbi:LxmA leader domain family RiPP [Pseudonocardia sp. ICBG601]|uniref:LxmA leader domain family RiPP n=1 Tax=Pseudonocardia sp. ICBG601 TaxID=2846759 RepID=UPI001CF6299D|nr:LxmA leader domain family RiPP [Pseudonocardia sp. ICBG601]